MKCSSSTSRDSSSTLPSTSTPYKRSRVRLQPFQKQQVVLMLNSGVSVRKTAEQFGIGQTTVRDIRKRSSELLSTPSSTSTASSAPCTSADTFVTGPSPLTSSLSTVLESEPADLTTLPLPQTPSSPTRLGQTASIPDSFPATVKLEPTDPDSAPTYSIDATLKAAEELFERLSKEPVPYQELLQFSSILRRLKSGEEQSSARTRQTSIDSFFKRT